jgi:hypothetical protein
VEPVNFLHENRITCGNLLSDFRCVHRVLSVMVLLYILLLCSIAGWRCLVASAENNPLEPRTSFRYDEKMRSWGAVCCAVLYCYHQRRPRTAGITPPPTGPVQLFRGSSHCGAESWTDPPKLEHMRKPQTGLASGGEVSFGCGGWGIRAEVTFDSHDPHCPAEFGLKILCSS